MWSGHYLTKSAHHIDVVTKVNIMNNVIMDKVKLIMIFEFGCHINLL